MPETIIRIVVADDHPIFREGVKRALALCPNFSVVGEASDGMGALEAIAAERPDIALLDVAMPDISGIEVLRRLKEKRSSAQVLFLTGAIDRLQTFEALQLGARGFVMKEAAADVLVRAIDAVMRGEYWIGRQTLADWTDYAVQHRLPRHSLTPRERQIVEHVLEGLSNREIAARLSLGEETIKSHVSNVYRKLGVSSRMELALYVSSGKLEQV